MSLPFTQLYQAELSYLRELGKEFASHNPSLAGALQSRSDDPDVERLLEGFAFLSARIRERIDGAIPEVAEALAGILFPQTVRPGPAASVVEFQPGLRALRGPQRVPAGTELLSHPVEGTRCRFQTLGDLELLPLCLRHTQLDESHPDQPALTMTFETTEAGREALPAASSVRLFLHAERSQAATLGLWLRKYLAQVEYIDSESQAAQGALSLVPALRGENDLHPAWSIVSTASKTLSEYFDYFDRLLFFDLSGFDQLSTPLSTRFLIRIVLRNPPRLPARLQPHSIRLHCCPVVNLFQSSAEPFQVGKHGTEALLRAARLSPNQCAVVEVSNVSGKRVGSGTKRNYRLESQRWPDSADSSARPPSYGLRRVRSPLDGYVDTYLSIPAFSMENHQARETVSADLLCTNRLAPVSLKIGDISTPAPQAPTRASFANITPVTPPLCPPIGRSQLWHFLGHVSTSFEHFTRTGVLTDYLMLHNVRGVDEVLFRSNSRRCHGIRATRVGLSQRIIHGVPVLGAQTVVEVAEDHFAGVGDCYYFGEALSHVLAERVGIDSFHELILDLKPSAIRWSFSLVTKAHFQAFPRAAFHDGKQETQQRDEDRSS